MFFVRRRSPTKRSVAKQEQRSVLFIPEGMIRPPGSVMGMAHLAVEGNCAGWRGRNNFQIFIWTCQPLCISPLSLSLHVASPQPCQCWGCVNKHACSSCTCLNSVCKSLPGQISTWHWSSQCYFWSSIYERHSYLVDINLEDLSAPKPDPSFLLCLGCLSPNWEVVTSARFFSPNFKNNNASSQYKMSVSSTPSLLGLPWAWSVN